MVEDWNKSLEFRTFQGSSNAMKVRLKDTGELHAEAVRELSNLFPRTQGAFHPIRDGEILEIQMGLVNAEAQTSRSG